MCGNPDNSSQLGMVLGGTLENLVVILLKSAPSHVYLDPTEYMVPSESVPQVAC